MQQPQQIAAPMMPATIGTRSFLLPAPVIAIVFLGRETVLGTSMSIPVFDSEAHIPRDHFSLHDLHRVLSMRHDVSRIVDITSGD